MTNIQHYCPAEHVNSVAFIPNTIHHLLASANGKVIRLYDLRTPTSSGTSSPRDPGVASGAAVHCQTRAVHGLTPDPRHENQFASWENVQMGSTVKLWDARKPGDVPLISFDVFPGVVGLEWLGGGKLAVGTREGVGVWDILHGNKEGVEWTTLGGMRQGEQVVAYGNRRICLLQPVVRPKPTMSAFAFTPDGRDLLCVLKDGTIGLGPVTSAPLVRFPPTVCTYMPFILRLELTDECRSHLGLEATSRSPRRRYASLILVLPARSPKTIPLMTLIPPSANSHTSPARLPKTRPAKHGTTASNFILPA